MSRTQHRGAPASSDRPYYLCCVWGGAGGAAGRGRPLEREETPVRESCDCGGEEEFEYREAVIDDGEWVLRCPECGHLDRLRWLSEEARPLVLAVARRRRRLRLRREVG